MHEIIQHLIHYGYPLLFLWVFSERLGIPIPATLPFLSAGILAEMGHMRFADAVILSFTAVMLADVAWFFLSRVRGVQVLSFLCRITMEPDACVRKTQNVFVKYGPATLLVAKFIPGLSNLMVPLVGIVHMRLPTFLLFDSVGSLIWVVSFMGAGYLFSREIDLEKIVLPDWGQGYVFIAVLVLITLYMVWKYLRKQYLLRELFLNRITPEELKRKMDAGEEMAIVDVRHILEFEADPYVIPGALYHPLEHLDGFQSVPAGREIVTYCA